MAEIGTQTGLVAFIDILGYQNLLRRNEPEVIAAGVIPILTGLAESVGGKLRNTFPTVAGDAFAASLHRAIGSVNWLVFSDTVLLTMPLADDHAEQFLDWATFLVACIVLQDDLFEAGLPVRGGIDFGKFFVKDTCFAGQAIIDAHALAASLEMAACVLTGGAASELREVLSVLEADGTRSALRSFVSEYLTPMKSEEKHMLVLNSHALDSVKGGIRGAVLDAFWGHNKDIPSSARQKALNTEQWFEFLARQRRERPMQE